MTPTLTFNGRMPGVVCQAALPPPPEDPLRLDVAGFVGFAERGPLDTPVLLEDAAQYRHVFGGDLPVAREGGRPIYAYLPGAVQAFFDNGGRRCYAVRVAGPDARPNRFRLPGLVSWSAGPGIRMVTAPAAWVGRWSDALSVGTQLRSRPLRLYRPLGNECDPRLVDPARRRLYLELPAANTVQPGDLLRLRFLAPGAPLLLFPVAAAWRCNTMLATSRGVPVALEAPVTRLQAFLTRPDAMLPAGVASSRLTEAGWEDLAEQAWLTARSAKEGGGYALDLPAGIDASPGDLLRLRGAGGAVYWFSVQETAWQDSPGSPPASPPLPPERRLLSREVWQEVPAGTLPAWPDEVDLLSFDLAIREGTETIESWSELRLAAGPAGWAGVLVTWPDCSPAGPAQLPPSGSTRLRAPAEALPSDEQAGDPPLFLPLGMEELPGPTSWAGPLPEPATDNPPAARPGKDGLDQFTPAGLFLDPALVTIGARDLLNEADFLLYLSQQPRLLRGVHSLLPVDEVALLAIPDLAHRPWGPPESLGADPEPRKEPPPPPDWSHFQNCPPPAGPRPAAGGDPPRALRCGPASLPFTDELRAGTPSAVAHMQFSVLGTQLDTLPVLDAPAVYDMAPLLAVQQALVTLAAARADQVAVLGLPGHFGVRETVDWQTRLTNTGALSEGAVLSYAAVYHPWLQYREEVTPALAPLRAVPPEGAVCGMIAAREHDRGPWIAPANRPLLGVVGLTPALGPGAWETLFDRAINLLHHPPGQFVAWSAHTLSLDPLLVQLSVRRLLIFLRKLCLRRGMRYVFENNNERFRRRVQAGFERTLNELLGRGAVSAFIVSTGEDLNTPNDWDNGRFLIALKIAPTLPIEFITVVLLRAGEGRLQVEER